MLTIHVKPGYLKEFLLTHLFADPPSLQVTVRETVWAMANVRGRPIMDGARSACRSPPRIQ